VSEANPKSVHAETSSDDEFYHLFGGSSSATLNLETSAGLPARLQALEARLNKLEPRIKEVRRYAGALVVTEPARTSSVETRSSEAGYPCAPKAAESHPPTAGGMSRIRRNLLSLLLSQGATMILGLVTVTIVPKYLGQQTFGTFAFATTFIGLFGVVSLLGSNPFLVKTIARDPDLLGDYVFNGLAMKIVLGFLLSAIAIAIAHQAGYPPQTVRIIEVGCLGMTLAALSDVLSSALQGIERMGRPALWTAIQQYATGAIAIGLLVAHKGVVVYSLVVAVAVVIPLIANGYHLWPMIRGHMRLNFDLWRVIAIGGLPFFFSTALLLIYGSIDIIMLQGMTNSAVVGWYSLAYRWVGIPIALPLILATVVLPSLSSLAFVNEAEFRRIVNRALQVALFAAIPMAVGIALVSGDIIRLLHYPAGFEHSVVLMRILAIHIPIVAMDMVLAITLAARDRQKAWLVVSCVAVLFNPTVNLIAIPLSSRHLGDGAIGAAIVTVATELVMMLGAIYLRPAGVLDRKTTSFLLRSVVAAIIMVPVVEASAGLPLGAKILVGMATFACSAWALRLLSLRSASDRLMRVMGPLRGQRLQRNISNALKFRRTSVQAGRPLSPHRVSVDMYDPHGANHPQVDSAEARAEVVPIGVASALPRSSARKSRLGGIDGLRAFAALWVVLFHIQAFSGVHLHAIPGLDLFMRSGSTGVSLFLVLSGFCLYVPFAGGRLSRFGTRNFLGRRCRRLMPAYYATLLVILVAVVVAHGHAGLQRYGAAGLGEQAGAHLSLTHQLFPSTFYGLNGAYWSLGLEWELYLTLPLLIFGARRFGLKWTVAAVIVLNIAYRLGLALAVSVGAIAAHSSLATNVLPNLLPGRWAEFALGMVAAELYVSGKAGLWARRFRYVAVAALPVAFAVSKNPLSHLIFGFVFFTLVCVVLEGTNPVARLFSWAPLVVLGTMSYSIYLVHQPLVQVGAYMLGAGHGVSSTRVFIELVLLVPAILAVAWLLFVTVERWTVTSGSTERMPGHVLLFPSLGLPTIRSWLRSLRKPSSRLGADLSAIDDSDSMLANEAGSP
jgi:peptidoglycan/LPS O-acetylase OafA/YrhL/O-antigen/teichoic acid export membrane protein